MNNLQKCQLNILKEFIRVCEENSLIYFLIGGSCLGAVRHQGFIPWDDDIDVAMPRVDYDKFITLQNKVKEPYFIQTYKTDKRYIYNYAKMRDSSTTYIENYFTYHRINHGVWIDIFPLDGMSRKDNVPIKRFSKKVRLNWFNAYLMYLPALLRKPQLKTLWKDIPLNLVAILFLFLNVGHYRNKMIDRRVTKISYNDALLVGNFFGSNPTKEAMPKEVFKEGIVMKFEGIDVKVPSDYDKYLTLLYGDYMKLPPKEKQVGHHHNSGLDLNVDYKTFVKWHKI